MVQFDTSWTLFLDRDGVINEREEGGYISKVEDFSFIPGTIKALEKLSTIFGRIVIVTNQAGIGKGIMTEKQLDKVHKHMLKTIDLLDGRIDKIYYCPDKPEANSPNRKPETGMAMQAKADFPEIEFSRSVIVGDSVSDMEFGARLGMVKVFIEGKGEDPSVVKPDFQFTSLKEFTAAL
ncbi:MAG: HAD family hydrolase [Saprospiraceae bacterium]|nr:HAD family hydrolase [Saprospiraceae bacterium]